jgi:hypothetical protein
MGQNLSGSRGTRGISLGGRGPMACFPLASWANEMPGLQEANGTLEGDRWGKPGVM